MQRNLSFWNSNYPNLIEQEFHHSSNNAIIIVTTHAKLTAKFFDKTTSTFDYQFTTDELQLNTLNQRNFSHQLNNYKL